METRDTPDSEVCAVSVAAASRCAAPGNRAAGARPVLRGLWLVLLGIPLSLSMPGSTCGLHAAPGQLKWSFPAGVILSSSPAVGDDGTIYIGSGDSKVYALDGATGAKKWDFLTGSVVHSSPAVGADGTVYVGSYDNKVYALDGATGARKWEFVTGGSVYSSPALGTDGTVYVGSGDNKVYALNGSTGAKKWEFLTGGYIYSSPALGADGTVYVGSERDWKLYALDGNTGAKKWEFVTGGSVYSSPALGADGTVYFGADDKNVYALDGLTGSNKWAFLTGGLVYSSPALGTDGMVYVGSEDQKVYALDGATGAKKWEFVTGSVIYSSPAVGADGTVYIGSYDHKIYALNGVTGQKQWEFLTGDAVRSSPAVGADGTVFVGSFDQKVYALEGFAPGALAASPWPKFRGNARNSGSENAGPPRIVELIPSSVQPEGAPLTWHLRVAGVPSPVMQWYLNGAVIPGATNSAFAIAALSRTNEGAYTLVATNVWGAVTNEPIVLGVNNVEVLSYLGLTLTAPADTQLDVHYLQAFGQLNTWQPLTNLTLPASPYVWVDLTSPGATQRFYRTTQKDRLTASLLAGWSYTAPSGSQHRIDFVNAQVGYTNWQFLTNLTLPTSPYLFVDQTATNGVPRYYRTTSLP